MPALVIRFRASFVFLLLAAPLARADIAVRPVTGDFDAEFARAADLLERGERAGAETILGEIHRRAGQRAWDARIALLLAGDDERRKDHMYAERRLRGAEAAAIGLEPYRRDRLARVLEAENREAEAAQEWQAAFESDEAFAQRSAVGRRLAKDLEKLGHPHDALVILERMAARAPATERIAIELERVRVGLSAKNREAVSSAARSLLLRAPTMDAARSTPPAVRVAMRLEERRLSAAERARRGRALVAAGDAKRGLWLLSERPSAWSAPDRAANQLALSRALAASGRAGAAEAAAAQVPKDTPEWYEATLFRTDLLLARIRAKARGAPVAKSPEIGPIRKALESVAVASAPAAAREGARERLVRLSAEADDFEGALGDARELTRETRGTVRGFEPVWELAWQKWREGDFREARRRFEALAATYQDIWRDRQVSYWRARCLEKEGSREEALGIYSALAAATPPDIYASFARSRSAGETRPVPPPLPDPSTEGAEFRRTDELLRLRMFEDAAAEARALTPSRGRDLRVAEADFALGRFATAAAAAKRAFPEIGTAQEGRVPDGWRRLHYPIEEGGFLSAHAREFRLDPALLRALVRQESVFNPQARSHAGALGLTQLLPGTAKPLAKSVLRVRYRRAFLYDPGVNARLGAAFFRQLLDRFGGDRAYALAAYNGGPARMQRVLAENRGRPEDEIIESHPFAETRDYVRRVLLYAESYRALYPERALP
ncbi:MAG TPA: lytic transglycosylase domain-containing protein [Thermoanaerobaculia bacterium]